MSEKKEYNLTYKLDYNMYKEFKSAYLATRSTSIIVLFLVEVALLLNVFFKNYYNVILFGVLFVIFVIVYKIMGRSKTWYKRSKYLNNNEEIVTTVTINEEKIILSSSNGNMSNYSFDKIVDIVETKNLLILKLKYNMGIILDKKELTDGKKEEILEYLFSVCKNVKAKKATNAKIWLILRRLFFVILAILFILSIILFTLQHNKVGYYKKILEENSYNVKVGEKLYNGYNTKHLTISKDNEHSIYYMYEFGNNEDAKRNINYWANLETDNNIKDEYVIENTNDYQEYVIDDNDKYIILIRKDNYVFYGKGNLEYKEELDYIVKNIIDVYMK